MDDDTTTAPDVQEETGAETAQPVEPETTETADVQTADEPGESTEDVEVETPAAPAVDDKLRKYAASQGFELDSPGAIKAAQAALKAQSEATRNYREKSELEKNLSSASDDYAEQVATSTGQDPELLKRLQRVEVKNAISDFYAENPDARALDSVMGEIALEKPHLAGDLEALLALAERKSGSKAATKSQVSRETLQKLAHTQQAAVPTGNATNSGTTPKGKPFKELSIDEMEKKLGFAPRG